MSISQSDLEIRLERLENILRANYKFDGNLTVLWEKTEKESNGLDDEALEFFTELFGENNYTFDADQLPSQLVRFFQLVKEKFLPIVMKGPSTFSKWPASESLSHEEMMTFKQALYNIVIDSFRMVFPNCEISPSDIFDVYAESIDIGLAYGNLHFAIMHLLKMSHCVS